MSNRVRTDLQEIAAWSRRLASVDLPSDMILGAATAAYQIEGSIAADGKSESIWDRFCRQPGVIADGDTGEMACDHYRRWPEDVALMRALNFNAYRFSIAWSRILPQGRGAVNQKGLDFYDRLVDALLAVDIAPFVTLYHWDLPQVLQDEGGWYRRGIADDFAAYADVVTRRLGDRVKSWATFNELWTFCWTGHAWGEDAPGFKDGAKGGLAASHHALLAHGEALPALRANAPHADLGIVFDLNVTAPASADPADVAAAGRFDGAQNRWYLDAVHKGSYPEDMLEVYGPILPEIRTDDLKKIAGPIDWQGINIYRRSIMAAGDDTPPLNFARVSPPGDYSAVNYEIYPPSIYDVLHYVHRNYGPKQIFISENGLAIADEKIEADGRILDLGRLKYYTEHLEQAGKAAREGVPLKGYFAWTLMDNFEWAYGYKTRFGLVHVDFATQQRRIKESGFAFSRLAARFRGAAK